MTDAPEVNPISGLQAILDCDLRRLAQARQKQAALKANYDTEYTYWKEKFAILAADVELASKEVADAYLDVTKAANAIYGQTGDKHPHDLVTIAATKTLSYNPDAAFLWAKEHHLCLMLDARAFDKMAKAAPEQFGFVYMLDGAQTRVASDLSSLLEGDSG